MALRGVATGGGGGVKNFKKRENLGKLREKFCHKWQHLWLLAHPIKFGQFYKNSIFGRFNEHTPESKWFRDAPDGTLQVAAQDWEETGVHLSAFYACIVKQFCPTPSEIEVIICQTRAGLEFYFLNHRPIMALDNELP